MLIHLSLADHMLGKQDYVGVGGGLESGAEDDWKYRVNF